MNDLNAQHVASTHASSTLNAASSSLDAQRRVLESRRRVLDARYRVISIQHRVLYISTASTPSASAWALAALIMLACAKTADEFWALRPYMIVALEQVAAMESLGVPDDHDASVLVALRPPLDNRDIRAIVAALPAVFDEVLALEEFKDVNFDGLLHSYEVCAEPEASDQTPQKTPVSPDSDTDLTNSGDDIDYDLALRN